MCGLVQVQRIEGQATLVSQIAIGHNTNAEPLKISFMTRANAWLLTGVKLITGDKLLAITATFKWCMSTRCLADTDLSDTDINRLRAQKEPGQIAYKVASQADVSIPVSFSGFGEAMDALQKKISFSIKP